MVHLSINTSDDDASDITKVLSAKRSRQIQVCKRYLFQHANHTNNQLVDHGANGGLGGSDMRVIYKTHHKINIQGIDNHEVTGLDVVTAATLLNTSLGKVTEFRQPIQVQSHLEMPRILVQLGHTPRT